MTQLRSQWVRLLSQLPVEQVKQVVEQSIGHLTLSYVQVPDAGLALVTLQDAAKGEPFYLGEMGLVQSHIQLSEGDKHYQGYAAVMVDDENMATLYAVCDAILAHQLNGYEGLQPLLIKAQQQIDQQQADWQKLLATTMVNFSLLSEAEDKK